MVYRKNDKSNQQPVPCIKWQSPSNIALIKYWGKHGNQLPNNASLSMTLRKSVTKTEMKFWPSDDGLKVTYWFEAQHNEAFEKKVLNYFKRLSVEFPFISRYQFEIHSQNTFPHSTGIASSASSMSALALCMVSLEQKLKEVTFSKEVFNKRASHIARLGSGSASRSIYGGWSTWGRIDGFDTSDEFASALNVMVNPKFQRMGDAVLLVSSKTKKVSSTLGHSLMDSHPFAEARYKQAKRNLNNLIEVIKTDDFNGFARIVEDEALTLHALLMTSSPDGMLIKPNSLEIINRVRDYRNKTGLEICFTLDAGPNIHLLYPEDEKKRVHEFINSELLQFCENEQWIDDEMGDGPVILI